MLHYSRLDGNFSKNQSSREMLIFKENKNYKNFGKINIKDIKDSLSKKFKWNSTHMHDVAIIDYKMGNLFSIDCALKFVGINSIITHDLDEIMQSKSIILPGVGAFPEAMRRLKDNKFDTAIYNFNLKKPIIGICLGMQLLFTKSHEHQTTKGLGILEGEVHKFKTLDSKHLHDFNVGGEKLNYQSKLKNNFLDSLNNVNMYFIHSYHVKLKDEKIETSYSKFNDQKFTSSIKKENIQAFNFIQKKGKKDLKFIYH